MTSLIPTVVALSSFFRENFPHILWYPYWYLGVPFQYLIGPVVPAILTISNIKYQIVNIYLGLIGASFFLGSFGIYLFLRDWGVRKREAALSGIFYLVFPAGVFLLSYQNGLSHIALGFLPYTLLLYRRFLQNQSTTSALFLSIAICFVLLIDISIVLPLLIGFLALFISQEVKKDLEDKAIKTVLIVALSVFLSTIWYTPRFWWVVFSNPSFGGAPLFSVTTSIFKLLLNLAPIVLAVLVARLGKLKTTGYLPFATLFFTSFLFLTIIRFLSDPDFIVDWVGFGLELQFGGAILLGNVFVKNKKLIFLLLLPLIANIALIVRLLNCSIVNNETMKQCNNNYQQRILTMLKDNISGHERVFLSGSSVFWLNSFLNIQQVRGGIDQASLHPFWAHGAYQIREGESQNLSLFWLRALGVSDVLVHEKNSQEPFHDFKQPEKFAGLKLISAKEGDRLYQLEGGSIARVADLKIVKTPKPESGADSQAVFEYVKTIKKPLTYSLARPDEIKIVGELKRDDVVSLAMTFDPRWRLLKGQGNIAKDPLGNLVITPQDEGEQEFELQYQPFWYDWAIPMLGSGITLLTLLFYRRLFPHIKNKLADDEYW